MTATCSNDFREHVVLAVEAGEATRLVARRSGIAVSTVVKWHHCWRKMGSVVPIGMSGSQPFILDPYPEFIVNKIK